jgi:hypothetical protein
MLRHEQQGGDVLIGHVWSHHGHGIGLRLRDGHLDQLQHCCLEEVCFVPLQTTSVVITWMLSYSSFKLNLSWLIIISNLLTTTIFKFELYQYIHATIWGAWCRNLASYCLHPGFKGTICKSLGPRWSIIGGEICLFLSFKDPLINKKAHALVIWSWKCKICSCKAAN